MPSPDLFEYGAMNLGGRGCLAPMLPGGTKVRRTIYAPESAFRAPRCLEGTQRGEHQFNYQNDRPNYS
jgi:hypothetical protein